MPTTEQETSSSNHPSLYEQMRRVNIDVREHDAVLEEHTLQLKVQAEQIKQLQDNGERLEQVVMTENRETRLTIVEQNNQLHGLINNLMNFKTGQSQLDNNLKMARMEQLAKIIGILAGSGGILYYIFGP